MHSKLTLILLSVAALMPATSTSAAKRPRSRTGDWKYTSGLVRTRTT